MAWWSKILSRGASNGAKETAENTFMGGVKKTAGSATVIGGLAGGGLLANEATGGGLSKWFTSPIQTVLETGLKAKVGAGWETWMHSVGYGMDVIGMMVATLFNGRGPFSDWLRNKGQELQGVAPEDRLYGAASDRNQAASATPGANGPGNDGTTLASANIDPITTESIALGNTAANEYSVANLQNIGAPSLSDVFGKVNHAVNGFGDGVMDLTSSLAGHVADGLDLAVGKGLESTFGVDTGYAQRDLSTSWNKAVMDNLGSKQEFSTMFDRAAYDAGNLSTWLIPAAATAKVVNIGAKMKLGVNTAAEVAGP